MGRRRKARELCIQVLFHLEYSGGDPIEAFEVICRNFQAPKAVRQFAKELLLGIWYNRSEIDALLKRASTNWRLERMSLLDRCILRLATYEIMFKTEIPPKVSIDEAVELGKRFGSENSAGFINGVLDSVFKRLVDEGTLQEASSD